MSLGVLSLIAFFRAKLFSVFPSSSYVEFIELLSTLAKASIRPAATVVSRGNREKTSKPNREVEAKYDAMAPPRVPRSKTSTLKGVPRITTKIAVHSTLRRYFWNTSSLYTMAVPSLVSKLLS
jgi:hypothetical protein